MIKQNSNIEDKKIFTIAEITRNIKGLLESRFANIWIEGEISDLKKPGSGHIYFILKDETSQIRAVMFRYNCEKLRFALEDGLKVIGFGTVGVYEKRGEYQIILEVIEPQGVGALQLAFEKLKKKLASEGLFDQSRKRPIPLFPQKIAVVTSLTGAAIRDILNVIKRRFCNVHIVIYSVKVQGVGAGQEIANAINELNKFNDIDVMIVGRGGGSLEDLWAFNEEVVARAIYQSKIPVISAVGHEIDYTIADFVADLRAPTPSAAAELVVQNKTNIENTLKMYQERLISTIRNNLAMYENKIQFLKGHKCLTKPREIIIKYSQEIDEHSIRIKELIINLFKVKKEKSKVFYNSILYLGPANKILNLKEKKSNLERRLIVNFNHSMDVSKGKLKVLSAKLDSLSPLAILARGYSIAFTLPDKKLLISSNDTSIGKELEIKLATGEVICEVKKTN